MFDTHVHLTWHSYNGRVEDVLQRARAAGVKHLLDLGINLDSSRAARKHANTYSDVFFGAGIHPNDAGDASLSDLEAIEELAREEKCLAVGEIGLDFYRDHTDPVIQEEYLRAQLEIAKRIRKPVVLHDRKASAHLLQVLDDSGYDGISGPGGVFHCFAGDVRMAKEVLERGFYISFTGNVTFKKSDRPPVVAEVPLDRLLLETDSPFLAPSPRRGRENEPAYLPYIAAAIATIKEASLSDVVSRTTDNAFRLFTL